MNLFTSRCNKYCFTKLPFHWAYKRRVVKVNRAKRTAMNFHSYTTTEIMIICTREKCEFVKTIGGSAECIEETYWLD